MPEKLNKLQIRAMVFDVIKSYESDSDFESKLHIENLKKLNSVEDKKFVCEILLKELAVQKDFGLEIVKYLLADYASLELIESSIWEILYNPDVPDRQKEKYLQLLRAFGGKVDVNELMECISDVDGVIDEQAQGLLEAATVNPEAQIDFLDFLMALQPKEQLILIKSLFEDFKGDEMANMLTPCLRIDLDKSIKAEIIDMLASIPSYLSVKPLKNYINSAGDDDLKRAALKALNQIRNAGVDIDNKEILDYRENEICKDTKFHKAFLSQVDGCGNQGLIFSRITNRNKVIMFSTVINITDGIMDCFGLYNITENDFIKVVNRFKANDLAVPISAQEAKFKLTNAERKSASTHSRLPYEYFCWSVYTCDIEENPIDYASLLTERIAVSPRDLDYLYNSGSFDSWFFEYDDNICVQNLINFAIDAGKNSRESVPLIENKIDEVFYTVFSSEKVEEYSQMLMDSAFIFNKNYDYKRANIAANISTDITEGNMTFLKDILKRSILQYLANIIADSEETSPQDMFSQKENSKKLSEEQAFALLKYLEEQWDCAQYE
ncbi:MAG: hypothetical protein K6A44_01070 [bacterium]|nr:hypothetical protein [bacterium]